MLSSCSGGGCSGEPPGGGTGPTGPVTVAPGYTDPGRLSYNPPGVFRAEFEPGQFFKYWRVGIQQIQPPDVAVFGEENGKLRMEVQAVQTPVTLHVTSVQDFPRQSFTASMEAYTDPQFTGGDFGSLLTFGVLNPGGVPAPQGLLFCGQSTQIQSGPFPEGQSGQQVLVSTCSTFATPWTIPTNIGTLVAVEDILGHWLRYEISYDAADNHVSGRITQMDTGRELFSSAAIEAQNPNAVPVRMEPFERFRFAFSVQAGSGWEDPSSFRPGRNLTFIERFESNVQHGGFYDVSRTAFQLAGVVYDDVVETPIPGRRGPSFFDAVDLAQLQEAGSSVTVIHDGTGLRRVDGIRDVNAVLATIKTDPPIHFSLFSMLSRAELEELAGPVGPGMVRIDAFFPAFKANGPQSNYTWLEPPVIEGEPSDSDFLINNAVVDIADGFSSPGFIRPVDAPEGTMLEDHFNQGAALDKLWNPFTLDPIGRLVAYEPEVSDGLVPQLGTVVQSGGVLYTESAGNLVFQNLSRLSLPIEGTDLSIKVFIPPTGTRLSLVSFGYRMSFSVLGPLALGSPAITCFRHGAGPENMVDYWAAESSAQDSMGNAHGRLMGGVAFEPGRKEKGFSFDGVDGRVVGEIRDPVGSQERTVSAWVQMAPTAGIDRAVFQYGDPAPGAEAAAQFTLFVDGTGHPAVAIGSTPDDLLVASSLKVDDGQWHHLAAVYTAPSSNLLQLWVDSEKAAEATVRRAETAEGRFSIGAFLSTTSEAHGVVHGLIDEVKVFSRALDEDEIHDLYLGSGSVVKGCGLNFGGQFLEAESSTGGSPSPFLCDLRDGCGLFEFENRNLTFTLSVHDGTARGEILGEGGEVLLSHEAPYTPLPGEKRQVMMSVISADSGELGKPRSKDIASARWDDFRTNIPMNSLYEMSASPLAVDGIPFATPSLALFIDDTPSEDAQIEEIRETIHGLIARILGGRPGPASGTDVWNLDPLLNKLQVGVSSASAIDPNLPPFINRDRTLVPFEGTERVHALLLRNPSTGIGATILYAASPDAAGVDPTFSRLFDGTEPFYIPPVFGDPSMAAFGGAVFNLYVGQGKGCPFKFRLPPSPPEFVGLGLPPEINVQLQPNPVPSPLLPFVPTGGMVPVLCLYKDGSATSILLPVPLEGDPMLALFRSLLAPKVCPMATLTSSNTTVAQVAGEGLPLLIALAPGETTLTATANGSTVTSIVRVVGQPRTTAPIPGLPTNAELLQAAPPNVDRSVVSAHLPQGFGVNVRVRPFLPVELEEPVLTCSSVHLSGNAGISGGDARANQGIEMTGSTRIEGDAFYGPTGTFKKTGNAQVTGAVKRSGRSRDCEQIARGVGVFADRAQATNNQGVLKLTGKNKLNLGPGDYYYDSIDLSGQAVVTAGQGTRVVVGNTIALSGTSKIEGGGEWFVKSGTVVGPPPSDDSGISVAPGFSSGYLKFIGASGGTLVDEFSDGSFTDLWQATDPAAYQSNGYLVCPASGSQFCLFFGQKGWPALSTSSSLSIKADLTADSLGTGEMDFTGIGFFPAPSDSGGPEGNAFLLFVRSPEDKVLAFLVTEPSAPDAQPTPTEIGNYVPSQMFHLELTYNHGAKSFTGLVQASGAPPVSLSLVGATPFSDGVALRPAFGTSGANRVQFDRIETNIQIARPPYDISRTPLQTEEAAYTSLKLYKQGAPDGEGAVYLAPKPGQSVSNQDFVFIAQDDAAVEADGVTTINAALVTTLVGCAVHSPDTEERVTIYTTLAKLAFQDFLGPCIRIDQFRDGIFLGNGSGKDYTWTLRAPSTSTGGTIDPPTAPSVVLSGNASWDGSAILIAPRATVSLTGNTKFGGAMISGHFIGSGNAKLANIPGLLPKTVLIPLGGGGGSGAAGVRLLLDYEPANFGPFGADPPTFGSPTRSLVHSTTLSGNEVPDAEGFVSIRINILFDAKDDNGQPLPSSPYRYSGSVDFVVSSSSQAPDPRTLSPVLASVPLGDGLLIVDNTAPKQFMVSPSSGGITNRKEVVALGFTDDFTSTSSFRRENGEPGQQFPSLPGLFITAFPSAMVQAHEGENRVVVRSTDPMLNEAFLAVPFTVDTTPPDALFTAPADSTYTSASTIATALALSDPSAHPELVEGSGLAMDSLKLLRTGTLDAPSVPLQLSPFCTQSAVLSPLGFPLSSHCSSLSNLVEGPNLFRVGIRDAAGNRGSDGIFVDRDQTSPVSRTIFPPDGACMSNLNPPMIVLWRDPEPGGQFQERQLKDESGQLIANATFELPSAGFTAPLSAGFDVNKASLKLSTKFVSSDLTAQFIRSGGLASLQNFAFEQLKYTLKTKIDDNLGNAGQETASVFTLDVTPPSLMLSHDPPGNLVDTRFVVETASYLDPPAADGSMCGVDPQTLTLELREIDASGPVTSARVFSAPDSRFGDPPLSPGPSSTVFDLFGSFGITLPEGLIELRSSLADQAKMRGNLRERVSDRFIVDVSAPIVSSLQKDLLTNAVPDALVIHAEDAPLWPKGHAGVAGGLITFSIGGGRSHTYTAVAQFESFEVGLRPLTRGAYGDFKAMIPENERNALEYPDAQYTVSTTVTDRMGHPKPFSFNFRIDRVPPVVHEVNVSSYQKCVDEGFFGCDQLETYTVVEAKVTDDVMMSTVKFEAPGRNFDLPPSTVLADWWAAEVPAATYPTTGDAYLVAHDKAGNEVRVKRISKDSGGDIAPPGVDATLHMDGGALAKDAFISLNDVKFEDATISLGGSGVLVPYNATSFSPGQLKYLGGAKLGLGGQFTNKPLKLCITKPAGYSLPSDPFLHVLVFRVLGKDNNKDGVKDLSLVDGVQLETDALKGEMICDALPGFPGVRRDGSYIFVELTEKTQIITAKVSPGHRVVKRHQPCESANLDDPDDEGRAAFNGDIASLGCFGSLPEFVLEVYLQGTNKLVGLITAPSGSEEAGKTILDAGDCDPTSGAPDKTVAFPSFSNGGPPSVLNSAEEEYPSFEIIYDGAPPDGFERMLTGTIFKSSGGEGKQYSWPPCGGEPPACEGHTALPANRYRLPSTYIGGFTSNVRPDETSGRSLTIGIRPFNNKTETCKVYSPSFLAYGTLVKAIPIAGPFPAVGFNDGGYGGASGNLTSSGIPDYCLGEGDPKGGPACDPGFPGNDSGGKPKIDVLGCGPKWFDGADPSTCHVSRLQRRSMEMARAGFPVASIDIDWPEMEPLRGSTKPFNKIPRGGHFVNLEAYVAMGQRYGTQITGILGNTVPFWASSCCLMAWDPEDKNRCIQPNLDVAQIDGCKYRCDEKIRESVRWYNDHRAGYKGDGTCKTFMTCQEKLDYRNPSLGHTCYPDLNLGTAKDDPATTDVDEDGQPTCALSSVTFADQYLLCSPDGSHLVEHVRRVVEFFNPWGTFAYRMGWPGSYGIGSWQYVDEHNAIGRYQTLISTSLTSLGSSPGSVADTLKHEIPDFFLVHSNLEYKKRFKSIYDLFFGVNWPDLNLGSSARLVVSGALVGVQDKDCPPEDGYTWSGVGSSDNLQRATGCFQSISPKKFYDIMEDSSIPPDGTGFKLSWLGKDKVVMGVNVQYGALSNDPSSHTRGEVVKLLNDLSGMNDLDIWMMNFGSIDQMFTVALASGQPGAPGPYAQAGWAQAGIAFMQTTQARRGFWFGYTGGERDGDVPVLGWGDPYVRWFRPLAHALSVAPRIPVQLDRTIEFRTGLDGYKSRVYLEANLEEGSTYNVIVCARPLDIECHSASAIPGACSYPCRGPEAEATCPTRFADYARAIYGDSYCPEGQVPVTCPDSLTVEDPHSPMCDINAEQIFQPRATMPFTVTWAPLQADGSVVPGASFTALCGPTVDKTCSFVVPSQYGSRRYSFALVPQKLYVPKEPDPKDPVTGNPLGLSLFDADGALLSSARIDLVLQASEGAYVEGVIRFEAVTQPMTVAKRVPRGP